MGSELKNRLLQAAIVRKTTINLDGDVFTVREVGALEFAEYGRLVKTDRIMATASLLAACIIDDEGEPMLTIDEAKMLAGSARASMPFVNAIMELSGFGDDEDDEGKASSQPNSLITD